MAASWSANSFTVVDAQGNGVELPRTLTAATHLQLRSQKLLSALYLRCLCIVHLQEGWLLLGQHLQPVATTMVATGEQERNSGEDSVCFVNMYVSFLYM